MKGWIFLKKGTMTISPKSYSKTGRQVDARSAIYEYMIRSCVNFESESRTVDFRRETKLREENQEYHHALQVEAKKTQSYV